MIDGVAFGSEVWSVAWFLRSALLSRGGDGLGDGRTSSGVVNKVRSR